MISSATGTPHVINRREFLYYLLGASLTVFAAGSCAGLAWMATPFQPSDERGGFDTVLLSQLPDVSQTPTIRRIAYPQIY